ncbi:MAG: amino acid adenylation domain-containing protein, partial [Emcibacteraceae bacterium]|nr:amino acid adenylation domain-containing protein [Emcibacteraceae bacterium]
DLYISTPMQRGMVFHGLLDDGGSGYTTQLSCDLVGELDVDGFKKAWDHIVARHDIFRTCFVGLESEDIHQLVLSIAELPFAVEDWRDMPSEIQTTRLSDYVTEDKASGFDFGVAPLMRISLLRLSDNRYHFIWSHHHALMDGWCMPVVFGEVVECYYAFVEGREPSLLDVVPYSHYIGWLKGRDKKAAAAFWKDHLSGIDTPTPLVMDKLPVDEAVTGPREYHLSLSEEVSEKLAVLAKSTQSTMNVILQVAWSYLLHRYSGEEDIVFGSTISGRPADLPGVETMMGLFINSVPVKVSFKDNPTIEELIRKVHQENISREEYGYLSLPEIQGLSDIPRGAPLFDSLIVFENYPVAVIFNKAAKRNFFSTENFNLKADSEYALTILAQPSDRLELILKYQADIFSVKIIEQLSGHLELILLELSDNQSDKLINSVSLLRSEEEHQLLVEFNDTAVAYPSDQCIHVLFEAQVEKSPDAVAVVYEDDELTYKELNERSNQLAHYLIEQGVKPDMLVGLCVDRSIELIIGIMGILKAGGGYVPLEPDYPKARLGFMIGNSGIEIVLSNEKFVDQVKDAGVDIFCFDQDADKFLQRYKISNPKTTVGPRHISNVIYSSGSTGQPKGAVIEHRSLVNFVAALINELPDSDLMEVPMISPISFAGPLTSVFPTFLLGCSLVIVPDIGKGHEDLLRHDRDHAGWRFIKVTPSHLKVIADLCPPEKMGKLTETFVVGGEALLGSMIEPWCEFDDMRFINQYGPAEGTVGCCFYQTNPSDLDYSKPLSIGTPLANGSIYILDGDQRLLPIVAAGEICIGGVGVARGYLNQPEMTAERFIQNPFSDDEGDRLYRTGDLGRWLPDGTLNFIGRLDNQVQIRGFRTELGEVEAVLSQCKLVRDNIVLALEDDHTNNYLAAYVVLQGDRQDIQTIKQHLSTYLPDYMVPDVYVFMDNIPLTSNGKVDRKSLPVPGEGDLQRGEYVGPRTEVEERLCDIWSEVLKVDRLGIHDNFFELGGHSLLATRLISLVRSEFDSEVSLKVLFEEPTVEGLATALDADNSDFMLPAIEVADRGGVLPLSYAQQRLWFIDQLGEGSAQYNIPGAFRFEGSLDRSAFMDTITTIIDRHEVLRTIFKEEDGIVCQVIQEEYELPLLLSDLSGLSSEEQEVEVLRLSKEDAA